MQYFLKSTYIGYIIGTNMKKELLEPSYILDIIIIRIITDKLSKNSQKFVNHLIQKYRMPFFSLRGQKIELKDNEIRIPSNNH